MKGMRVALVLVAWTSAWLGAAPATATTADPKAPAATAPAKPAIKPKPREQPEGRIAGITIARPDGRFLGLQVLNNNLVLTFYDAKKHPMPADVTRGTVRWSVKYQPQDERAVLNATGDPNSLTSAKTVRPPHNFKVFLALFVEGNDTAVESYSVDLLP